MTLFFFFLGSRIVLINLHTLLLLFVCFVSFTRFQAGVVWPFFFCYLSVYPPFPVSLQAQLLTSSLGSSGQFYLSFQIQYKIFWQFSNAVFLSRNCSLESMEEFLKMVVPRLHLRPTKSGSLVMGSSSHRKWYLYVAH